MFMTHLALRLCVSHPAALAVVFSAGFTRFSHFAFGSARTAPLTAAFALDYLRHLRVITNFAVRFPFASTAASASFTLSFIHNLGRVFDFYQRTGTEQELSFAHHLFTR
jgi:hypothetical protein